MSPGVEPASFFSMFDMVRAGTEDRLGGRGDGPLTAYGELARERRDSVGGGESGNGGG